MPDLFITPDELKNFDNHTLATLWRELAREFDEWMEKGPYVNPAPMTRVGLLNHVTEEIEQRWTNGGRRKGS